jgi:membrane protease YdiL (CAAX protease family)
MSAAERTLRRGAAPSLGGVAVLLTGFGLLLWRAVAPPHILTSPVLAVLYGVLLAMSLTGPSATRAAGPIGPIWAGALGAGAALAARLLAGPAVAPAATVLALLFGIVAAVAEEAFFRRFLYARLEGGGVVAAMAGAALLFAVIHVPAYGWGAFPVDLAAGLLFSWQRWASGSWLAPASTHVLANVLAVIR